ncbi:MAG: HAMP domain-containing histidine kinase [Anaerolineales bacterium]|nr:HAMP domain-containing histidine kinase [Anaerolineales bacterium]
MSRASLAYYTNLIKTVSREDWKAALTALFVTLRETFVFDNLAIYVCDHAGGLPEVIFARAVGRGKSREADASWGEEIATQVLAVEGIVMAAPTEDSDDRIAMAHRLGLPLPLVDGCGVLVFVRFGGPTFLVEETSLAVLAAAQTARILERRSLREHMTQLELARHRAQLQDDFIATVSHDLHTPLGFIKGYATSLLRPDTTWDIETQREFLTIIDEESDHLIDLIDRLLDSARLQSGMLDMDFQPVRLDTLLRDVVLRSRGRTPSLEVNLDLQPIEPIQADNVRLGQVFENLLDNAAKYAPDTPVTIRLESLDGKAVISVSDRGPGISAEHMPFIFERFYRVPEQSSKRGTGLGLFICKQIVQAHRGRITVHTAPGKGTSFRIELPVKQEKGKKA